MAYVGDKLSLYTNTCSKKTTDFQENLLEKMVEISLDMQNKWQWLAYGIDPEKGTVQTFDLSFHWTDDNTEALFESLFGEMQGRGFATALANLPRDRAQAAQLRSAERMEEKLCLTAFGKAFNRVALQRTDGTVNCTDVFGEKVVREAMPDGEDREGNAERLFQMEAFASNRTRGNLGLRVVLFNQIRKEVKDALVSLNWTGELRPSARRNVTKKQRVAWCALGSPQLSDASKVASMRLVVTEGYESRSSMWNRFDSVETMFHDIKRQLVDRLQRTVWREEDPFFAEKATQKLDKTYSTIGLPYWILDRSANALSHVCTLRTRVHARTSRTQADFISVSGSATTRRVWSKLPKMKASSLL